MRGPDREDVWTLLLVTGLWGLLSVSAVRRWRTGRAGLHRDEQLRRLLAGRVVPTTRAGSADGFRLRHR